MLPPGPPPIMTKRVGVTAGQATESCRVTPVECRSCRLLPDRSASIVGRLGALGCCCGPVTSLGAQLHDRWAVGAEAEEADWVINLHP